MSTNPRLQAFAARLRILLLAPYPIVHLRTWEEARSIALLNQVAAQLKRPVTVWRPESEHSIDAVISAATEAADARVWVLTDAHPYLNETARIRSLRVAARRLHDSGVTLVFVSPAITIPEDLSREWNTLDVPLPGADELLDVLAEGHNPERLSTHLPKCFEGLAHLEVRLGCGRKRCPAAYVPLPTRCRSIPSLAP
jgi:hypothetical protein